jgi:ubiquinone/menaquinone biosynthesis C-methylase UbiE
VTRGGPTGSEFAGGVISASRHQSASAAVATPQQTVAAVYDEGAVAYERFWAPVLHRHTVHLLEVVPVAGPDTARTVVDVATGAGTLLPALQRVAGPGGRVLALDRSLGMLQRAPASTPRVQADAVMLPLPAESVDILVFAFVLFMLPDARAAVVEATRVLEPGGWLLAATWGAQLGTDSDTVVREELDRGGAPAFPELARSDALTDSKEAMGTLLADEFRDVHTTARPLEARFSPDAALAMRTGCGTSGWRFARLDPGSQDQVRRRIADRLHALPDDEFVDGSEVLLTTARRR